MKKSSDIASEIPRVLPRGTHKLSRDVVVASQRERMLDAITELSAAKGFAAVTVSEVVALASVGKSTFYEQFEDKEACFIAAYNRAIEAGVKAMEAQVSPHFRPEERVAGAVRALVRFIAEDAQRARLLLLEPYAAGPKATSTMMDAHRMAAQLYVQGREIARQVWPEYPPISITRAQSIVGAIKEPLTSAVQEGKIEALPALEAELVRTVTAMALAP